MQVSEAHRLQADHAPTPFSAAEIRAGCQPPRTIRLRVEPAGQAAFERVNRFVEADLDGALQETQRFSLDGAPLDEPIRQRATWLGFQEHASFPERLTTISEESIELPAGRFDCWLYQVRDGGDERRFWFARDLPGMPIRMEEHEDGVLTFRMVMLENVPGATLAG